MKHPLAALALLAAAPALAQSDRSSPFDGTWKGDPSSAKLPAKPDVFAVRNGVFSCSTCTPPVTTKADGRFHAVPGHDYWDELSVTVDSPTQLSYVYRKAGKEVSRSTDTLSADGRTLTSHGTSSNNANGTPVESMSTETRVAAGPAGSHAVSGSWRQTAVQSVSAPALLITLQDAGDRFTLTAGTGETIAATYGGPAVPVTGDPGGTTAAFTKVDASTIRELDTRGGKPVTRYTYRVAPDGRSIAMTVDDLRARTTVVVTLNKQ